MPDEPENNDDSAEDAPAPLRSGRVRIVGAEPADQLIGRAPEAAGDGDFGLTPIDTGLDLPIVTSEPEPPVSFDSSSSAPLEPLVEQTELPHWTEAPTGEVPAVLMRDLEENAGNTDPWAAMPAPTWREEHADWEAGEGTFEPSMLAHDETKLGSLDDSGDSDLQPWSFELPGSGQPDSLERPAIIDE